jgi:hypothetical protein
VREGCLDSEARVAIAGDWHSSRYAVRKAFSLLRDRAPDVRTVLHLGDFNLGSNRPWADYRKSLGQALALFDLDRILVTPGNHDDWGQLGRRFAAYPGEPYFLPHLESVAFLPRGFRFTIGPRSFVSFGGAASLDQEDRIQGKDWWPEEQASALEAELTGNGGRCDVMLTHEAVDGGSTRVDAALARPNRELFSQHGLDASRRSRALVTDLWKRIQPSALFHGHMNIRAEGAPPRRSTCLFLGRQ